MMLEVRAAEPVEGRPVVEAFVAREYKFKRDGPVYRR
jgi:hypothetical protein